MQKQIFIGLFPLGTVVVTPGCMEVTREEERISALTRHVNGDWGGVSDCDKQYNDEAMEDEGRLLSAYLTSSGLRFWIITEWDRSVTTILLPEEY
ncbi:hypothetical protein B2I21_36225 [Chryseobacterium mucoviscidosis]|nr:hypothetical protein B2I21_36225 [Chryseobacterium mucoviscidosis]